MPDVDPAADRRPRKVLFYRNPMGLPDVAQAPKKDSMGMDYIPVYEGEAPLSRGAVKLSLDKVQRSGVRTEAVTTRVLVRPVHSYGTVKFDERKMTSVSLGVDAYVDEVFVSTVGQTVRVGEPLFRLSSSNPQMLQVEIARRSRINGNQSDQSLQNLLTGTATKISGLDWPSPATGVVIEKRIFNGQKIAMGEELLRIADTSKMWIVSDVPEMHLASIKQNRPVGVLLRAYPNKSLEGKVLFIYPSLNPETRTARICVEVQNSESLLKAGMYADVTFHPDEDNQPVTAVPDRAIIDDGTQQRVLIAKGDGLFEPRQVKLGMRALGYAEVLEGVEVGETVVTTAAFLIDSESNIQSSLEKFRRNNDYTQAQEDVMHPHAQ
jgi:Cu(I)/Ag(I) efflux system membrane fusion protein